MFGAIDGARVAIQPVVEANAVEVGEPSVVSKAHVALLAADGGFTLHEAVSLAGAERAIAHAHRDSPVLEGASLVDICAAMVELVFMLGDLCGALLESRSLLRSSLSKAKSGG